MAPADCRRPARAWRAEAGDQPASDVLDLADALERLDEADKRLNRGVEFLHFGGLSYAEIAQALDISRATVDRDLRFARAWLRRGWPRQSEAGSADGA